jgi:hypothetical protein
MFTGLADLHDELIGVVARYLGSFAGVSAIQRVNRRFFAVVTLGLDDIYAAHAALTSTNAEDKYNTKGLHEVNLLIFGRKHSVGAVTVGKPANLLTGYNISIHSLILSTYERYEGDVPAVIFTDGEVQWWRNGKMHRDNDLPACILATGARYWYRDGLRHRGNDLPAVVTHTGTEVWYRDGLRHRAGDMPAFVERGGKRAWFCNGDIHRDSGKPAVIAANGRKSWYVRGKFVAATGPAHLA